MNRTFMSIDDGLFSSSLLQSFVFMRDISLHPGKSMFKNFRSIFIFPVERDHPQILSINV